MMWFRAAVADMLAFRNAGPGSRAACHEFELSQENGGLVVGVIGHFPLSTLLSNPPN